MKKLLIWLIFLLSVAFVSAGDTHYLNFTEEDLQLANMSERDIARFSYPVREYEEPQIVNSQEIFKFNIVDKRQALMIRQINANKNSVDVTAFIEGAEVPSYATLSPSLILRLDFERDGVIDMFVKLIDITDNQVTLLFQKNKEGGDPNFSMIKKRFETKKIKEKPKSIYQNTIKLIKDNLILAIIILIVIIGLISKRRYIKKKIRKLRRRY